MGMYTRVDIEAHICGSSDYNSDWYFNIWKHNALSLSMITVTMICFDKQGSYW
jgi:hypothetical protein